jgi:hypothetical protein
LSSRNQNNFSHLGSKVQKKYIELAYIGIKVVNKSEKESICVLKHKKREKTFGALAFFLLLCIRFLKNED